MGRDEVKKLVLKIDYHVTEKTRGGRKRSQSAITDQVEVIYALITCTSCSWRGITATS